MSVRLLKALGLAALAALLIFGIVRGYEAWRGHVYAQGDTAGAARVQKVLDAQRLEWAADTMREVTAARDDEQRMAAAAAQGEKNARDRAEARALEQADAARRAASAAGGLSRHLADLDADARAIGIPDAASCPALFTQQRDAAIRARALFGQCVVAYRVLGGAAGSEGAALRLQLDTALSWIRATGAPGATELPN